ncbi:hypothetical protein JMUB6875_58310 [Nocardia sp. JMUB6875]|uniref:hypothetical protein n=1 Tax=Nocardia sp. JMUB6875 TaxID=3158170 RepID=UPI0032E6590E
MNTRHRITHQRGSRWRLGTLILLTVVAAASAACTSKPQETGKPTHTAQEFCAPFLNFFQTEFPIKDVKLGYLGVDGKPDAPVKDVQFALTCRFDSTSNSLVRATASLTPVKPGDSDTKWIDNLKELHFVPLQGHQNEIWIQDSRTKEGPIQTKGTVEMTTRIAPWTGSIEILNERDSLAITDAQISSAADLLIKTTEAMGH